MPSTSAKAKVNTTPSPSRTEKNPVQRPGAAKSVRTLSNSSIPTLSNARLARQASPSTSNASPVQASPLSARRPVRSAICPSSSRPALASAAALDLSQDHHRSDSGRSTGSSRSTATTDSFFLPQHPHVLNRRFKDLPAAPSSSVNGKKQTVASDVLTSALDLDITIDPSAPSASLPSSHLFRSKSSISTTPTSPEEGNGSSIGGPDFQPLEDADKLRAQGDHQDDFWHADYPYAGPSADPLQATLTPLMRADAPVFPSQSQALDPLAAPLRIDSEYNGLGDDVLLSTKGTPIGSATPLVAANLQKLNLLNDDPNVSPVEAFRLSSPVLSAPSGAPTPTKCSDDGRHALPRVSPYQHLVTAPSPSSSTVNTGPLPNKSSSSLSSSSAHDHEKAARTLSSKRSSTSSSSSFRMTLSRQAKSLRNSFMWTPPASATTPSTGREYVTDSHAALSSARSSTPLSQGSSPGLAEDNPKPAGSQPSLTKTTPPTTDQRTSGSNVPAAMLQARKTVSAVTTAKTTSHSSHSSSYIPTSRPAEPTTRPDPRIKSSASSSGVAQSSGSRVPTDYSKADDRPKSRLSSRLALHNTYWSMKLPHLTTKKTRDHTVPKSDLQTAVETGLHATSRRTKSQASLSSAAKAAVAPARREDVRDAAKQSSSLQVSGRPEPLSIVTMSALGSEGPGSFAQLSPSFAATFAFLNSQIDSPHPSPPLLTTMLPTPPTQSAVAEPIGNGFLITPTQDRSYLPEKLVVETPVKPVAKVDEADAGSQQVGDTTESSDAVFQGALFDRLAESPEAVYKTLAFPEPATTVPASRSLGSVAAASRNSSRKLGHKKNASLGSAALISKSARAAAADFDKLVNLAPAARSGLPLANKRASTTPASSIALPPFTPMREEGRFFDALTSPFSEQTPSAETITSPESVLPSFATAKEFFPSTGTEPSSPALDRTPAHQAATSSEPQLDRTSLGRRLSGVFDASKARAGRKSLFAPPPQSPRVDSNMTDALPARPETSLGFHLRNPLRRDRKESLKTAGPPPPLRKVDTASPAKQGSAASTVRGMSFGLGAGSSSPARKELIRSGTSLGFSPPSTGASREFSSRVTAPTKSSMAKSVQPSPPSASRHTVRSVSATPPSAATLSSHSRSPQRPANPPSSFRGSPAAGVNVYANESPSKSAAAATSFLSRRRLHSMDNSTASLASIATQETTSGVTQGATMAPPPNPAEVRRSATKATRPVLDPIRTSLAQESTLARPSTAAGFRGPVSGQNRKMSQPTLDMVDDREFLEALEQVRAVQRERIHAQAQEVENKSRLARLGMMSGNHLKTKGSVFMLADDDVIGVPSTGSDESDQIGGATTSRNPPPARPMLRHRRSASADAKLVRTKSTPPVSQESEHELDQRQKDIVEAYAAKVSPVGGPTSGLEWGVGKASGKLHDGTFVNDDDWKKEVKALFLIRELVQTERSYARHLSSLLSMISNMQVPVNGALSVKRKSTSNLFAAYSASKTSSSIAPSHIALLRTYLPQLITLSSSLVQRVEENPTSAGVGAAFDVLSAELESTFVGWSSVASQALKDLRQTEQAKAKSPYKIGLVPLLPRESTEVGASMAGEEPGSSGHSSPAPGTRNSALRMTSLTRPVSPVGVRREPEAAASSQEEGAVTVARSTKRRSTITSVSFISTPRVVVAPSPPTQSTVLSSSPEQENALGAAPSRRFHHSRSQSTLATPLISPTSAVASDSWPTSKSLTPMDITIMPTQRIPRYGLMLRDLLRNTPPESLSHARVQRAITLIQKVALMCDAVAPVVTVKTAPNSGAATPMRAGSVLGMTPAEQYVSLSKRVSGH